MPGKCLLFFKRSCPNYFDDIQSVHLNEKFAKPATLKKPVPFNVKLFLKDVANELGFHLDRAYFNNLVLYIAAIDQMFSHWEHNPDITETPAAVSIEGNTPLDVALIEEWHHYL